MDMLLEFARWVDLTATLIDRATRDYPRQQLTTELDESFQARVSWNWQDADGTCGVVLSRPLLGGPRQSELTVWEREHAFPVQPLLCFVRRTLDPFPVSAARSRVGMT